MHFLAHQLPLTLIVAVREVFDVHTFFQNLIFIVNIVSACCKYNDGLHAFQVAAIEHLVAIGEIETDKQADQEGGLQQPKDGRWSSHFKSIYSIINGTTCLIFENIV